MGRKQRLRDTKKNDPKCCPKPQEISKVIKSGNLKLLRKIGKFDADKLLDGGLTPLALASFVGNVNVVRYLAGEARADVNQARTDGGCTPLFIAAQNGNLDVVRYLAREARAEGRQARTDGGCTPIFIDAQDGKRD